MAQPYLFYSERCPNSSQIIETLKALNKTSLYKFILVEGLARDKIPTFLKKVPTLYVPETKEVIIGKDIYGYIAKPTNARKEHPVKDETGTGQPIGELTWWGFEGNDKLSESYALWDSPTNFSREGGSMYTFIDSGPPLTPQTTVNMPSGKAPDTKNTIEKSKTGSNDDISARLEAMNNQRKSEYGGVQRK
jgi:hypothetical protein